MLSFHQRTFLKNCFLIIVVLFPSFEIGKSFTIIPHPLRISSITTKEQCISFKNTVSTCSSKNDSFVHIRAHNELRDSKDPMSETSRNDDPGGDGGNTMPSLKMRGDTAKRKAKNVRGRPPILVEDTSVLIYDIFLLLNLSVSISVWVVHRANPLPHVSHSFSEGSLLCLLWVVAGLRNGLFLYSAVDGHYVDGDVPPAGGDDERVGGPRSAGLLAFNTFVNVANLRIVIALVDAVVGHRHVGDVDGEMLLPLELGGGLLLMSFWRMLHSSYVTR